MLLNSLLGCVTCPRIASCMHRSTSLQHLQLRCAPADFARLHCARELATQGSPDGSRACTCLQILRVAVRDPVEVTPLRARPQLPDAAMIYADVANFADKPKAAELNADDLIQRLIRVFSGQVGVPQSLFHRPLGFNARTMQVHACMNACMGSCRMATEPHTHVIERGGGTRG
eukprot:364223-Chlamydomonas_euryale.AAC.3